MSTITYTVTVASAKFLIDDAVAPKLTFRDGDTYVFDQADSSNSGHILQFSITSNNSGSAEYTTGVTKTGTPGSAGAKTTIITSTSTTDTLYYYSSGGGTYGEEFSNSGFNTSTTYNLLKPIVGAEATAEKWGSMINHSIDQISEKFTALDAIPAFDDNRIQTNIALLGFKVAVNGSLAKYDLQDQIVDEYVVDEDHANTGIDKIASLNEVYASGSYSGTAIGSPTVTEDADDTGIDGLYTWYKWTTVGAETYQTDIAQDYDYLVVAGGGGGGIGGARGGGGGGAGGFRTAASLAVAADTSITVTVGAGGAAATSGSNSGVNGGISVFSSIESAGGGGGGSESDNTGGIAGGSGGGGSGSTGGAGGANGAAGAGNTPVTDPSQGIGGGVGKVSANWEGGGGGGASGGGVAGASSAGGNGGAGQNNIMGMNDADSDAFLTTGVVNAGVDAGDGFRYFSGGGGGAQGTGGTNGSGGSGGGGAANSGSSGTSAVSGIANTGGGGGGHGQSGTSGAGGSGIVIIRRLTSIATVGDLTLQSIDTTAETEADYADMVILIEDVGTAAVLNTDIMGFISEDSGVTFTKGALVDEGHWGVGPSLPGKRILAFHDLDISAQSGTAMCYKITTHNQAVGKQTKIHATSIGWR